MKFLFIYVTAVTLFGKTIFGCQFHPPGEYLRFVRVPENLQIGQDFLKIEVHPRRNLNLSSIDRNDDVHYFTYRELNETTIALVLARSLDDLVDTDSPQNVLKFKLVCDYEDGEDTISSSLSVTVYVEDLNDNSPIFLGTPYELTVDELTPVGLTIFRRILAADRDKPNTPNSDVQYSITGGNERGMFALDGSHQAFLILRKPLDYDTGDREFTITVTASDRGIPQRSTNASISIKVQDADDLSPKFTKGVYRTRLAEFYPLTGEKIHHRLKFEPPIFAYDQDLAIDAAIRYDILAGNDRHLFYLDHFNGSLFLEREIDLEAEGSLPGNTFVLQIQASQVDDPLKFVVARVEVEILDVNDNLPEFEVDRYNISIVENIPKGFSVLQIIAKDPDQGDNSEFSYDLEDKSGAFVIDPRTGWLTVRNHTLLDREKFSHLTLTAFAREKTVSVITNKIDSSAVPIDVTLLDINDNNPMFIPNNIYEFISTTSKRVGEVVGQVQAVDLDLGRNGLVQYSIQKTANATNLFKIDTRTGQLFVNSQFLVEGNHTLLVEASDQPTNPSEKRSSVAVVTIRVYTKEEPASKTSSDHPEFLGAPYEFWVGFKVAVGTSIGQIRVATATDNKRNMFDLLHSYKEGVPFAVEEKLGIITVIDNLNKYNRSEYEFEAIFITEGGVSIVTNVTIHVVHPDVDKTSLVNYRGPATLLEFHIRENKVGALIGKIEHNSTDRFSKFTIANQRDVTDYISISSDGSLYTQKAFDREKRDLFRLTILAEYMMGTHKNTEIYQLIVYVDDENDNAPVFEHKEYEGKILENSKSGTEVNLNRKISAKDADVGLNGHFAISIFGNGSELFRLDRYTGRLYLQGGSNSLNREEKAVYILRLIAKDDGGLYGEAKLTIIIEDTNDNAPTFKRIIILPNRGVDVLEYGPSKTNILLFQEMVSNVTTGIQALTQTQIKFVGKPRVSSPLFAFPESIHVGNSLFRFEAEDLDLHENSVIKYEMLSETYIPNAVFSSNPFHVNQHFMMHPTNGEIVVARSLPPESSFILNVVASDKDGLKDNVTIRLFVNDVNDHPPMFSKPWYSFDVEEATYSQKVIGRVEAVDSDFGPNANVSYHIHYQSNQSSPFSITKQGGAITVHGKLDREQKDKYRLSVVASDNPSSGNKLSTIVSVEVNILDVNDNAPMFYGYDNLIDYHADKKTEGVHAFAEFIQIPVYYGHIFENSPIGTSVTKVFANDTDFLGNGNGLFLFSISQKKNHAHFFTIDSKDGVVSTVRKLNYDVQRTHNVTVIVSDLGSPSLSSTALVVVNVLNNEIKNSTQNIFLHRYYEIEVEENVPVPLKVMTLNVTEPYRKRRLRFSIVAEKNSDIKKTFQIDPRNGTIFITSSPDREKRENYELLIRLDEYKVARDMTVMVYPVSNERLGELGLNEVKVVVRITDVNDNAPNFTLSGKPLVTAIPNDVSYGYHVIKLQAFDPDWDINGKIRYQILGRADEASRRFVIDPTTGQVRTISSFANDAGRLFGFDVKATDRNGADDGRSTIANVLVYILDQQRQLVMTVQSTPIDIENNLENFTSTLCNITGFDIRVRKIEPVSSQIDVYSTATDVYLYAVDPLLNVVVDADRLQRMLDFKREMIDKELEAFQVLGLTTNISERKSKGRMLQLSTLEIGVVVLGCLIFICCLIVLTCAIVNRQRKKRLKESKFISRPPPTYGISTSEFGKTLHFPSNFEESIQYTEAKRDVPKIPKHSADYPRILKHTSHADERARSIGGLETSMTSLHSSGKDSGIIDESQHCPCGQSSSVGSEGSCRSSYEDSLNSENQPKLQHDNGAVHNYRVCRSTTKQQRRKRKKTTTSEGLGQRPHTVAFLNPYSRQIYPNSSYLFPRPFTTTMVAHGRNPS
ncbi:cadherin-89D isoform X1 [Photinus pyralis]|uniref:cadherin-89D isoform X1 n=1 Tax=Photinus pyralis TaxID=7054 RepID=UPI001267297E|nr:cadherin-89D isoform X1 [Photinus pyralis]